MRIQSLTAHTQYAELLEQALVIEALRSLAHVWNSIVTCVVNGQIYH
jgi:hypothetical protein